jgi:integrase
VRFMEAVHRFEQESGRLRTPVSVRSFEKVMRHLHKYVGIGCDLDEVDAETLTSWCLSNSPAPSTVKKRRGHARSFFGWCAYKGWIDTDPSSGLGYSVQPGRGSVRTHTWLSREEIVDVIRSCPDDLAGRRDQIILMLGAMCGLRADEMCQLRWDSFSPGYTTLTVRGKGNKPAVIGVPPELQDALKAWERERLIGAKALLPRFRQVTHPVTHKRVRIACWDQPLAYDGVLYAVKAAGKRCGYSLKPHDLRRTYAGLLEDAGVPVTDIQRLMRHSDVGTTSRYLDRNPRRTTELAAQFHLGVNE